jgi:hypothetical protein
VKNYLDSVFGSIYLFKKNYFIQKSSPTKSFANMQQAKATATSSNARFGKTSFVIKLVKCHWSFWIIRRREKKISGKSIFLIEKSRVAGMCNLFTKFPAVKEPTDAVRLNHISDKLLEPHRLTLPIICLRAFWRQKFELIWPACITWLDRQINRES